VSIIDASESKASSIIDNLIGGCWEGVGNVELGGGSFKGGGKSGGSPGSGKLVRG